jgi:ribosomal protein S18 acetylase RimI-like enzyme
MTHVPVVATSEISPGASAGEHTLRRATAADVEHLAGVLANAFCEDPIYGWLIPSSRKRPASLRRFFEIQLRIVGLAHGSAWTTSELAGAAISTPPGSWRLPASAALRNSAAFAHVFGAHMPRALGYLLRMERRHVHGPHHYIATVGVAPSSQGQGLGSKLLGPTLDLCDAQQCSAYIEASSERNAALYERLGFAVTGEMRFRDSPPLRLMLRLPLPREPGGDRRNRD